MIDIIGLLSSDGYIMVNKCLSRLYGLDAAVMVGELCAEYIYYNKNNQLTDDNGFYSTQANIEENTTLNEYAQRKALKILQDANIIKIKKQGLPAKNYFYINTEKLIQIFSDDVENKSLNICTASPLNFKGLVVENLNINNNKTNNNNEKQKVVSKDTTSKAQSESAEFDFGIQTKTRKPNMYDKCLAIIDDYTNDSELRKLLIQYLNLRLEMSDKPLKYANQWKGLLNLLSRLSNSIDDQKQIVNQSIIKGWGTFVEIKDYNRKGFNENIHHTEPEHKARKDMTDEEWYESRAKNPDGSLRVY